VTSPPPPPILRTGKLCSLEIPAPDVHRSASFYERAFGWTIRSRDSDRPSFDDTTGQVSGAFVTHRTPNAEPGVLIHIMTADAMVSAARVREAGGTLVLPVGLYQRPGLAEREGPDPAP
jgi:uncharacterized protein